MVTPISPELSLALGIASNPGVYALLLGSGISRSAGIPTGWEVVLDLIRKLAAAVGADPEPDPAEWYTSRFGEPPQYSALLEQVGPQAAERQSLLRGHFEASDEELAEGIKMPTEAHQAIAALVAAGWIRVIVTTNFDRLLETALESAGVSPAVISTADQAAGAAPLAHSRCTVIKAHGDYLDARIRNSEGELASYEPPVDALLDQVLDEYGLIVCGWSGEYDTALRAAIERCASRRYSTYWCVRGEKNSVTEGLVAHRAAQEVPIDDADSFFTELLERVTTIHESGQRHPLDTQVAVETLKRYLPEERYRIRMRELVRGATEELVEHVNAGAFPTGTGFSNEELIARVQRLEALSDRCLALMASGCSLGAPEHDDEWLRTVRRLAEFDAPQSGTVVWIGLYRYPALLHLYTAGIAAVAEGRHDLLASLLLARTRSAADSEPRPIVRSVFPHEVVPTDQAHILFPHENAPKQTYKAPLSQYLHRLLRPVFIDLIPDDHEYTGAFARFEYLASLAHQDLFGFCSMGSFIWQERLGRTVATEIDEAGEKWPLLQTGLFDGSIERLREAKRRVDEAAAQARWW